MTRKIWPVAGALAAFGVMATAAGAMRASVYREAAGPSSRDPKLPCPSTSGSRSENGWARRTIAS